MGKMMLSSVVNICKTQNELFLLSLFLEIPRKGNSGVQLMVENITMLIIIT
jgi:hypothetical protein